MVAWGGRWLLLADKEEQSKRDMITITNPEVILRSQ
jgi:hypothetical protein